MHVTLRFFSFAMYFVTFKLAHGQKEKGHMIKRKSLVKVDFDIIILGIYYVLVIFGYLIYKSTVIDDLLSGEKLVIIAEKENKFPI